MGRVGEIVAYCHEPGTWSRRVIARFATPALPYLHSFGLTRDEVIVLAHPWMVRPSSLLWSNAGLADHFRWEPQRGTRLIVLGRDGSGAPPAIFETESMFVFHTVNAFRDGADRVLDVLAYPDAEIVQLFRTERLVDSLPALRPSLRRIRMSPDGRASVETLCESGFEFPAIHYRKMSGQKYRYVRGSTGAMAVLDAQTLEPHAFARIETPIPLGFHGASRARERSFGRPRRASSALGHYLRQSGHLD